MDNLFAFCFYTYRIELHVVYIGVTNELYTMAHLVNVNDCSYSQALLLFLMACPRGRGQGFKMHLNDQCFHFHVVRRMHVLYMGEAERCPTLILVALIKTMIRSNLEENELIWLMCPHHSLSPWEGPRQEVWQSKAGVRD